jgi:hypothetical protein
MMAENVKEVCCHRCKEIMEAGYATWTIAHIGVGPPESPRTPLVFVVPGEPTSINPVKAFQQGLQGDRASKAYGLRGYRCPACGTVELIALDKIECGP